jgi:tryptophan synthase alpha chain
VVKAIAAAGADLIELGIPFSDPLADGPTIQYSTQVALQSGTTVNSCLEMVAELRHSGVRQPFLLMGYYNPVLACGVQSFVEAAARAGADGFIIPDLPPEEAGEMEAACSKQQLALVYLLAPTSTKQRIIQAAARTSGFLYLVSLTGVTGARSSLPQNLESFVQRVRAHAQCPLAVGFGISNPRQARAVAAVADGVIVGSALIEAVRQGNEPAKAAVQFTKELYEGLIAQ